MNVSSTDKIQLYSLATPNGQKVSIALEEMEIPYDPHTIDIRKGEQFTPEFIRINPNSKIPAIVDPNGPDAKPLAIMESGAILIYLAEKSGRFLSPDKRLRSETLQWLFFQVGGVGPMFGQFGHFYKYAAEKCTHPYPLERYKTEARRILSVLDVQLSNREYLIDDGYSIADMATFPWVGCLDTGYKAREFLGLDSFIHVMRWHAQCMARPKALVGSKVCSLS